MRSFSFRRRPAEKILNGKGPIELAREKLVKAVNRLGVVRGNGRSGKVN